MHFIFLGSGDFFSIFIFFKDNIKKLKSKSNEFVSLSMKSNSQVIYLAFFSDRFKEKGETFQAFRSNHSFWRLSDAAILL
ncbi:Uncharacterized protein NEOC65_000725 [Neochlamydia sp. AcF65]|nr:Uncharacterized protein [Neochlamydia sp. AcF65]